MPEDRRPRPGTGRAYLLDRLERGGHVELLAAVEAGTLSAFAAAVEAGDRPAPAPARDRFGERGEALRPLVL